MKYDPWDDINCQSLFIESNYEDFEQWANEKGIFPDYYCDHEYDYCQAREEDFLEFAAKNEPNDSWQQKQDEIDEKADEDNQALKERED